MPNNKSAVGVALLLAAICVSFVVSSATADSALFSVDLTKPTSPWRHFWEACVGSGHALLGLRQDWREHLAQCRQDLGFQFVRFHGLLDDDMSTYLGNGVYSFFNVDSIFDFLLSIGMKPLIELSFMPEALASGASTVMHYKGNTSPPKDYNEWAFLIGNLTAHLVARYGAAEVRQWYFEVWNEPNLDFWNGTQAEYFKLYTYTAAAIKGVDSRLRVGGPASAQSQWIPDMKNFCSSNSVPIDFISTHEYPTDVSPLQRDIMYKVISKAKQQASPLPIFYTEYNDGLFERHDTTYASAFIMYNMQLIEPLDLDVMSWWTFSDIFEEQGFVSTPFHGLWGLLNVNQIAKPSYRAFQLLHRTGDQRAQVDGTHPTAGVYLIKNSASKALMVIGYNHNIPNAPIDDVNVQVQIKGVQSPLPRTAVLEIIDDTHANAPTKWVQMGSPQYPTQQQIATLQQASQLVQQSLQLSPIGGDGVSFNVTLAPQAVFAVTIEY